jgi:two-component system, LytTR family, response regulator
MPRKYRTLIVDDSELARADLIDLLAEYPQIDVVGEADSVASAAKAVHKLKPDLLFLDIQFPGESGFDLLETVKIKAKIIFVTAFDEYAIRAFQVNALDYLLKPVYPDRLAQTLERLESSEHSATENTCQLAYDDLLFLELNGKYHFLRVNCILKISSAGMYSEVTTCKGQKGLIYKTMKDWEARLPANRFVRVHRTTIINVEHVEKIEEWFNYSFRVFLKSLDKPVVMSRRYAASFRERMS